MVLPKIIPPLTCLNVYESKGHIIISGYCEISGKYRLLDIERPPTSNPGYVEIHQSQREFTAVQLDQELKKLSSLYKGLSLIHENAACIFGLIRLLESYYLILVTEKRKVASFLDHDIFSIVKTAIVTITYKTKASADETRYKALLDYDLTKDLFFCHTYDITKSLQRNATDTPSQPRVTCQSMFVWNSYALKPLLAQSSAANPLDRWIMPIVHGYVKQRVFRLRGGAELIFTLLARRSRHFAGTRYLRRGVDCEGHVANEVETEQVFTIRSILSGYKHRSSSLVQCRGSVPLYWCHINLFSPKPDVKVEPFDICGNATRRHLNGLFQRYGDRLTILNLVKQSEKIPKEILVGSAYKNAVDVLNEEYELKSHFSKGECFSFTVNDERASDSVSTSSSKTNATKPSSFAAPAVGAKPARRGSIFFRGAKKSADAPSTTSSNSKLIEYIDYDFLGHARHSSATAGGQSVFVDVENLVKGAVTELGFYVEPLPCSSVRGNATATTNEHIRFPITLESLEGDLRSEAIHLLSSDDVTLPSSPPASVVRNDDGEWEVLSSQGVGKGISRGMLQHGVLRTNCMDCLDRTNVAQFCYAKSVIKHQLRAIGLAIPINGLQEIISACMEAWAEHGDTIATQYGGSGAMHKVDEQQAEEDGDKVFVLTGGAKNALVAVQRYYSNISTDFERQQAIDLLLGIFEPRTSDVKTWSQNNRSEVVRQGSYGRRTSDTDKVKEIQATYQYDVSASRSAEVSMSTPCVSYLSSGVYGLHSHRADAAVGTLTQFEDVFLTNSPDVVMLEHIEVYPFPAVVADDIHTHTPVANEPVAVADNTLCHLSLKEREYFEYIKGDLSFPVAVTPPAAPLDALSHVEILKRSQRQLPSVVQPSTRESESAVARDASNSSSSGITPFEVRQIDSVPTSANAPLYIFPEYENRSEERVASSTSVRSSIIANPPTTDSSSESIEMKTEKKWSIWPFRKQSPSLRSDEQPPRESMPEEQPQSAPPLPPDVTARTSIAMNGPPANSSSDSQAIAKIVEEKVAALKEENEILARAIVDMQAKLDQVLQLKFATC